MNGYLPHRARRGGCKICCSAPSLWPFVGQALGFTVISIDTPSADYITAIGRMFPQVLSPPSEAAAASVCVVFGDWSFFQHKSADYWAAAAVPHVCYVDRACAVVAPEGWVCFQHDFRHAHVGGITDGVFALGILVRDEHATHYDSPAAVPSLPIQAPSALCNVLNSTIYADAYTAAAGLREVDTPPQMGAPPKFLGRLLLPGGLAPVASLDQVKVVAPCVFHRPHWGVRKLDLSELGGVWDVPILFQEGLVKDGERGATTLRQLCRGCPGKVLHLGTDYLLGVYCRGGVGRESQRSTPTLETLEQVGLREVRRAAHEAATQEEADMALDIVVKQEGQKSDDAEVPVHLWDGMWMLRRREAGLPGMKGWHGRPKDMDRKSQLPRWRMSLQLLRRYMFIRFWRRSVTRSFCIYARRYNKQTKEGRKAISYGRKAVVWSRKRRKRSGAPAYMWTDTGRADYKKFWELPRKSDHSRAVLESGREALGRVALATWWDWNGGSSLFFWRWPESHSRWAREGQPHFVTGELPRFEETQRKSATEESQALVQAKVNKVRRRMYIAPGLVLSLTHMFDVPKPPSDIRMVYDGTASGLNDALFAPHFTLPVVENTMRSLLEHYYSADLDVGEMFLNWPLGKDLQAYAGVDVTHVQTKKGSDKEEWELDRTRPWERWVRNFMGLRDSPYRSLQLMIKAKYYAYGDRHDRTNPFQWDAVLLNLPGDEGYDPSLPWVMKVRKDGHLACEVYVYVDDGRFTGWSKMECWKAVQRFSSILTFLGIQDAFRKRTEPLTRPGPWAGTVTITNGGVFATVSALKWAKTKSVVLEMVHMLEEDESAMPRKRLEQIRGFLIYVGRTYRWMNPYLKGIHLTIDGWRLDRDEDGYRIKRQRQIRPSTGEVEDGASIDNAEGDLGREDVWEGVEAARNHLNLQAEVDLKEADKAFGNGQGGDLDGYVRGSSEGTRGEPPEMVKAARRLEGDLVALSELTAGEEPALQVCRVKGALSAVYLMGDASGKGFGSGIWDADGLAYAAGSWENDCSNESSNWREAENLTKRIEEMGLEGRLDDMELFVFTDNSTYEGTFYKGYSKTSKKLTAIILRLRKVERETGCILHVIHIAGTRMKAAGVDGLSRCDFMEGIMAGKNPWSYVPLNEDADHRSEGRVADWVKHWWHDEEGKPWCLPLPKATDEVVDGGEGRNEAGYEGREETVWESSRLVHLEKEDWFRLHEIPGHRLWIPPPAAMTTVMELFAEDHLVNPHLAHVFVIPRLMTHMWRKHLFKDADLKFYVQAGAPFWPRSMHEPLTVVVVFPLAHVVDYRGPWTVRGRPHTERVIEQLDLRFKRPEQGGRREFLDLEEPMPGMWDEEYKWTWDLLRKFLHEQRRFPPVRSGLLRGMLQGLRGQPISSAKNGGRRRRRGRDGL